MTIKVIRVKDLEAFIRSDQYLQMNVLPITPERAVSQVNNPNVLPDDPALWIAFSKEGRVIGFAGSLPARDPHNESRMGWNTCWWIDPDQGREAAMPLFYNFLKEWDQHVAFSDMTQTTYGIIRQMDFCHTREQKITAILIRASFKSVLAKAGTVAYPFSPLLVIILPVVKLFQRLRIMLACRGSDIHVEIRKELDKEMGDFIISKYRNDFSKRHPDEFNWIRQGSWLVPPSVKSDKIASRYPFSYTVLEYDRFWLSSRKENRISSLMLVSIREGSLKVLYFYGDDPKEAVKMLIKYISGDRRVKILLFSHSGLDNYSSLLKKITLLRKDRKRYTGISKKILKVPPDNMIMQMGDGDAVFT